MTISDKLAEQIFEDYFKNGKQPIGSKLPTLRDLAKEYDSSITTVSKVTAMLAANGWLKKRQGSGLFIARKGNHMFEPAKSERLRIGFICPTVGYGPMPPPTLQSIMKVARKHNAALEMAESNWELPEERHQLELMHKHGASGIILQPSVLRDKTREYLAEEFHDIPIVVIDLYQPAMKRPHIIFDNFSAGRDLTRHLILNGHKNISFIAFEDTHPFRSLDDRVDGYRQALKESGIEPDPDSVVRFDIYPELSRSAMIREAAYQHRFLAAMERILSSSAPPTAIITPSDWFALRAIRYLQALGITQEEITVCGFDNLPESHVEQWLTTGHDSNRLGELAAETLFSHIESMDFDPAGEITLPCPLVLPE